MGVSMARASGRRALTAALAACLGGLLAANANGAAAAALEPVSGQGCYTYGDSETPAQGREAALAQAKRRAVASHKSVVRAVSAVEDFELKGDVVETVVAGALTNMRVVQENESGREICVRVKGKVDPDQVDRAIEEARARLERMRQREEVKARRETDQGERKKLEGDARCSAYLPATVRGKQPLAEVETRAQAREKLVGRLMMEAARQRSGALVEGASKSLVASKNGNVKERFMSRFSAQARGFVKYSVVRNEVVTERGQDVLAMTLDARVCVPREPLARTVAVVAAKATDGRPVPELRNELAAAFGSDSTFSVVDREQRHDIAVRANIINVGMFKKRVSADDLPEGKAALAGKYYRMVATLAGSATMNVNGARITKQVDAQDLVPASQDARLTQETYVKKQMAVLAQKLRTAVKRRLEARLADAGGGAHAGASGGTGGDTGGDTGGLDF